MMIKDLVRKNRTCRRFYEDVPVSKKTLEELVDLARLSASAANKQPLRYILSCEKNKNDIIFNTLAWAAYLKDWPGPIEGEKPSAYIIMLNNQEISKNYWCDPGIAAQSIECEPSVKIRKNAVGERFLLLFHALPSHCFRVCHPRTFILSGQFDAYPPVLFL